MKQRISFIHARIKTWQIFEENYKELYEACEYFTKPEDTYEHDGRLHTTHLNPYFIQETIERRFHNFLAASKTLVDHTRILMKNHENYDIHNEFKTKIDALQEIPVVRFCHDLRNYFLHISNPIDNVFIASTWYEDENHIISKGYVRISK